MVFIYYTDLSNYSSKTNCLHFMCEEGWLRSAGAYALSYQSLPSLQKNNISDDSWLINSEDTLILPSCADLFEYTRLSSIFGLRQFNWIKENSQKSTFCLIWQIEWFWVYKVSYSLLFKVIVMSSTWLLKSFCCIWLMLVTEVLAT